MLLLAAGCTPQDPPPYHRTTTSEATAPRRLDFSDLPPTLSPGSAEPDLNLGADGQLYLSWIEPDDTGARLRFARWEDDRWSTPRDVAGGDDWFVNWADVPSVTAAADGTMIAHWLQKSGADSYAYDVRLSISTDGGERWSGSITPHDDGTATEHGFVSIVPGEASFDLIWLDGREMAGGGHGAGSMTLRSATVGRELMPSDERLVDRRVCDCCSTDAVRLADGSLLAFFRDRDEGEIRDIATSRRTPGGWSDALPVADDRWRTAACPVNGPAADAEGERVAVAWFTAARDAPMVQVAFSDDAGRSYGPPWRVDDGRPQGRVDLELLPDGSAIVSWLESRAVRLRHLTPDGAAGPSRLVETAGDSRATGFPRLTLHQGAIFLAWTDEEGAGRVRTARLALEKLFGMPIP